MFVSFFPRPKLFFASAILVHEGEFKNAGLAAGTFKNVSSDNNQFTATDNRGKAWTYHVGNNARTRLEFLELIKLRSAIPGLRDGTTPGLACVAED